MTNIDLIQDPEIDLMGRATELGEEIKGVLGEAMKSVKAIGDVRGRGLMIGVELVADQKTKQPPEPGVCGEIAMKLLDKGIIITPCGRYGNVFRFMPPLTIPRDYALKATGIMLDILREY